MPVPTFQEWFLPLLTRLKDKKDHRMADLYLELADEMKLSAEDRSQLLKSGTQPIYENRIGWARTYLKKAGLIEAPSRGVVRITARGDEVLAKLPPTLNVKFLRQYPEFIEFHTYKPDPSETPLQLPADTSEESPFDTLERVHSELENQLAIEILERVKKSPPSFFERLVIDLLLAMGYGGSRDDAGRTLGKSGDGGIDGVINEDRLGLDVIYVQAKRWEGSVGRPVVQAFAGSLEGVRARKGVMITTSTFTSDALQYVRQIEKRIILLDGVALTSLMIQHNVGLGIEATYHVKRIDADYFPE